MYGIRMSGMQAGKTLAFSDNPRAGGYKVAGKKPTKFKKRPRPKRGKR